LKSWTNPSGKEIETRLGATVAAPVPVKATVSGLGPAFTAMARLPVRAPLVLGWNLTLIVQEAPAGRCVPQLLVWVKSPVVVMLEIPKATLWLFFSVTVWAELMVPTFCVPKVKEDGVTVAGTTGAVPVPERLTVCGLFGALSVIRSVPVRLPVAFGLKVTLMVQLPRAGTARPQLFVWA
jgi:hypothetical protein